MGDLGESEEDPRMVNATTVHRMVQEPRSARYTVWCRLHWTGEVIAKPATIIIYRGAHGLPKVHSIRYMLGKSTVGNKCV